MARRLSTCTAARWGCWNVNWSQLVDHVSGDLVSGDNTRRMSLVVHGGAGVLLEHRQHAVRGRGPVRDLAEDEPGLESQVEGASFSVSVDFVSPASDFLDLIFVCVDCDFWKVPFYVYGGAVVLLKRVGFFRGCGTRRLRRQREPLLPGGVTRRRRRPGGAAGTSRRWLSWSRPTRSAAHWCCWNADSLQLVAYDNVNLHLGCSFRTEFFDVNGGARVLLERRQVAA